MLVFMVAGSSNQIRAGGGQPVQKPIKIIHVISPVAASSAVVASLTAGERPSQNGPRKGELFRYRYTNLQI